MVNKEAVQHEPPKMRHLQEMVAAALLSYMLLQRT